MLFLCINDVIFSTIAVYLFRSDAVHCWLSRAAGIADGCEA